MDTLQYCIKSSIVLYDDKFYTDTDKNQVVLVLVT